MRLPTFFAVLPLAKRAPMCYDSCKGKKTAAAAGCE